ncbi:MAG: hypothetical protein ACK2TZ_06780 [Anaerolineales bacterium]
MANRKSLFTVTAALVLSSLACNALQVGVVTPTPDLDLEAVVDQVNSSTAEEAQEAPQSEQEGPAAIQAVAWQGHIASMPEGSQFDDVVILNPEGTGEYGLVGATPEIEAEIRTLRDGEGPQKNVHLWGSFSCGVEDVNGCQLVVDKLQSGATMSEEDIVDWIGTIKGFNFNSGPASGLELTGPVAMTYGIYASQDPAIQAEIERLRDTGTLVQVSGKLLVGFPDVNSTRIEVSSLQVLEEGSAAQPTQASFDPTADWQVFTSSRYGYQVKYPEGAQLSMSGPVSFSADALPEGMTPDEYMDSLLKEYTDQLCVEIQYGLGFIYISAPPNNSGDSMIPCGTAGFGAGDLVDLERDVEVGSTVYRASGYEYIANSPGGETLDLHNEILWINIDDGTRIAYGATPRTDATYQEYLMKTRDTLEQIIGTYQELN